ncbi:MAG: hypothetical protein M3Q65_10580 [Chloroflexota bacterium]|nr:hypothetical protein [Chloroflexota bacterium]
MIVLHIWLPRVFVDNRISLSIYLLGWLGLAFVVGIVAVDFWVFLLVPLPLIAAVFERGYCLLTREGVRFAEGHHREDAMLFAVVFPLITTMTGLFGVLLGASVGWRLAELRQR